MRILLAQNTLYVPAHGGANKTTRALLGGLAARGHECRAIVRAGSTQGAHAKAQLLQELAHRGMDPPRVDESALVFRHEGVEVHAVLDGRAMTSYVQRQKAELEPDWILVSSEDPGQWLLEACLPRAVYLAQTTLMLPFGPGGFAPFPRGRDIIRRAAGVIAVSHYIRDYLRRWADVDSVVIRPPVFGSGPFPVLGAPERGAVTIVNPCACKGITLFLELAQRLPTLEFAAVRGWGTTGEDERALAGLANVRLRAPADTAWEVLADTSVLLMPSLWAEAFGLMAIEAMLHGIPVLASDVGGLPEAKLGVPHLIPVRPIERYEARFDERLVPRPVVPPQDCGPWLAALTELLRSRSSYEALSAQSRAAALAAVATMDVSPFEEYLQGLG
jgi:glycosyltransferase involved in cell wall biosynthesis